MISTGQCFLSELEGKCSSKTKLSRLAHPSSQGPDGRKHANPALGVRLDLPPMQGTFEDTVHLFWQCVFFKETWSFVTASQGI